MDITGLETNLVPGKEMRIRAVKTDKSEIEFMVISRLDVPVEVTYFKQGGILPFVLRHLK